MYSITPYIKNNPKIVEEWLTCLFGEYLKRYLMKGIEVFSDEVEIPTNNVCRDKRRLDKCYEVLRHYGILKEIKSHYDPRFRQSTYLITINHEAFLKEAPKYALRHEFKSKLISKPNMRTTNRTLNYPRIQDLSTRGLIHYYFNKDQYTEYDRIEVNSVNTSQKVRVIRIYPKDLESDAERAAFETALLLKFQLDIPTMVKVVFDFEPEVLRRVPDYMALEALPNIVLDRVNEIKMDSLCKEYVKDSLDTALRMKDYIEASIRDLQLLYEKVPETYEDFKALAYPKLESHIMENAPLMIASENELERVLAAKVFTGGNKGLI